ncbi:hypothetical protein DSL92_05695 [Billgrantia gudaonensis]|uniref:Uncharacterized protein n=1 Tax=Billgrantia gudaonensis TaxID=376427 RepID=A0A3S0Q156_9GAMM|nr:hypothetical protein DSL92_05695 [Halomonas gudaonensis]
MLIDEPPVLATAVNKRSRKRPSSPTWCWARGRRRPPPAAPWPGRACGSTRAVGRKPERAGREYWVRCTSSRFGYVELDSTYWVRLAEGAPWSLA